MPGAGVRPVESLPESRGKPVLVACRPEVEEEQPRLLVDHVVVDGGHVNAVVLQGTDHWIDFVAGKDKVLEAIAFVKQQGNEYMDLYGQRLVDSAIVVLIGHLLLAQGAADERKKRVARRYVERELPTLERDLALIGSGDQSAMQEYDLIAGPPTGSA